MPNKKEKRGAAPDAEAGPKSVITELSHMERMSAVCNLFAKGKTVGQILEEMEERYGNAGKMKRETPYKLVREAGERGLLRYAAPPDHAFERRISNHFLWLKRVNVVRTVLPLDVARETAAMLLRLVQECHKNNKKRNEVHIGFAAGLDRILLKLMEECSEPDSGPLVFVVSHGADGSLSLLPYSVWVAKFHRMRQGQAGPEGRRR